MDNKKFTVIFVILLLIILGLSIYSLTFTIRKSNSEKLGNITIEEFNNLIIESDNFLDSKVKNINQENIDEFIDVNKDDIDVIYGKKSLVSTDASMYLLLKPKIGKLEDIYSKVIEYGNYTEQEWSNYLESQYDIVKDRKIGIINNDFIFYIISEDAYDIIKNMEK